MFQRYRRAGLPEERTMAADVPDLAEAVFMESYESRHSDHSLADAIAAALGFQRPPLRMDSQVKYGLLGSGHGHLFLRFPHEGYRCVCCCSPATKFAHWLLLPTGDTKAVHPSSGSTHVRGADQRRAATACLVQRAARAPSLTTVGRGTSFAVLFQVT